MAEVLRFLAADHFLLAFGTVHYGVSNSSEPPLNVEQLWLNVFAHYYFIIRLARNQPKSQSVDIVTAQKKHKL